MSADSGHGRARQTGRVTGLAAAAGRDRRRWLILGIIGLAQLMVVLDATIVNIALPPAQRALHFSNVDRQWVVTAYALAFGSLLLLGGRLADLLGRSGPDMLRCRRCLTLAGSPRAAASVMVALSPHNGSRSHGARRASYQNALSVWVPACGRWWPSTGPIPLRITTEVTRSGCAAAQA